MPNLIFMIIDVSPPQFPDMNSLTGYTSPTLLPPSSISSYNSHLHASMEQLQSIDLNVTEKIMAVEDDFRPPNVTVKLPPAIASFMSRVRKSSTEPADSLDGAVSPPQLGQTKTQQKGGQAAKISRGNSTESRRAERAISPLATVPPLHIDSPRLVRMQMSPTTKVSPQSFDDLQSFEDSSPKNDDTLKRTNTTQRQWIDDDSQLDRTISESVQSPSLVTSHGKHPSTSYSDASVTITTSGSDAPVYDTPKAVRKQYDSSPLYDTPKATRKKYDTNVVHPETSTQEPNSQSSFTESNKLKGLMKYAQRNADPIQEQKKFAHTWDPHSFDEPETKQVGYTNSHMRRSTEPIVPMSTTTYRPVPSPNTPLTPLSQHTQSDVAPHTFTYPNPPAQNNELGKLSRPHQPLTSSSGGLNTRPETGQAVSYTQANPRSRNYRPQTQGGHVGGEVRRTQTFSSGQESEWSNRYQQEGPRQTISPISDDSLPNSPTYFITNNPNDDRDTPSPGTQVCSNNL